MLKCPYCKARISKVIDKRGNKRRRLCLRCNRRYNTYEEVEEIIYNE